jgi:Cu/Ag efflux pump CusA
LISHYKTLQAEGLGLYETIMQGSRDRLSPILMTALTAGLALIPLALGGDLPGNEIQSPMAKVILGGLLSSTLLNLFVVPIVYFLANRNVQKTKQVETSSNI